MIRKWVTECLETHASCGRNPESVLPTRLLDISARPDFSIILIETKDLDLSSSIPIYATISHCWGTKEFLKTSLRNIETLKAGIDFSDLPRTFQDAVSVARELAFKYIWIDSLCITQDSHEDWKHESALMASVYSNSYLNIAATASSESSEPFLCTRAPSHTSVSIPTGSNQSSKKGITGIKARGALTRVHKLFSTPSANVISTTRRGVETRLFSRAWIFQERYLAPRTVHFHPSELVFECRAGLRCECTGLDHFTKNPVRNFEEISFLSWYSVVEEFTSMKLTYPSDRLEALMGVAKIFSLKLGCAYLKGLWAHDMGKGLLWNVSRFGRGVKYSTAKRQSREVAPTWSWASLVLAGENRIFFAAGEDPSFHLDPRFQFLGTDPPIDPSQEDFRAESGAVLISSGYVNAIACLKLDENEREYGVILMFEKDIDDMVFVTSLVMRSDVESELQAGRANNSWEVSCLLIGSDQQEDAETDQPVTYYRMMVIEPSSGVPGSWERLGTLYATEEDRVHHSLKEKIFRLV
jgi:hypothetical protein